MTSLYFRRGDAINQCTITYLNVKLGQLYNHRFTSSLCAKPLTTDVVNITIHYSGIYSYSYDLAWVRSIATLLAASTALEGRSQPGFL